MMPARVQQEYMSISSGGNTNCGVLKDSTVHCWGADTYGISFLSQNLLATSNVQCSFPDLLFDPLKQTS